MQYAAAYNTCSCVDLITLIFISKTSATCIFHYYGTLSKNYKLSEVAKRNNAIDYVD